MKSSTANASSTLALGATLLAFLAAGASANGSTASRRVAAPQETPAPPMQELPPLPDATPEALQRWQAVLAASRTGEGQPKPIRAFLLNADVLTRSGAKSNQFNVEYRYLAPHYIRFRLPDGLETGRGPGNGRKGYWLRKGDEVRVLSSRTDNEDRRSVDSMLAVARNFLALSDPQRLRLTRLEELPKSPALLSGDLAKKGKKLSWLRVASPDFALVHADQEPSEGTKPTYSVDLGIDAHSGLPAMALIRSISERPGAARPEPMLIHLTEYLDRDGFRMPRVLFVHRLDRRTASFEEDASQEIYVTSAALRPNFTAADFAP